MPKPTDTATDKPRDGVPDANEFGQIRAFLAQHQVSEAAIRGVIGTGAQGRTRLQIAALLIAWCNGLPKAG